MAPHAHFTLVSLLIISVLHASDNRHVDPRVDGSVRKAGNPEIDDFFFETLLQIDNLQPCAGMKEQLTSLKSQLQETSQRNSQLDKEALGLRTEIQQLNLTLSTCSSALLSVAGSNQSKLLMKMNNLLEVIDGEIFAILKIMTLTRDVSILQKKVELAAESSENSTETTPLQRDLEQKTAELDATKKQIFRNTTVFTLILQIISLQNQIWDLHQTELNRETALQPDSGILELQEQLNRKISDLREEGDSLSDVLELIFVRSKIAMLEKRLKFLSDESSFRTFDAQEQCDQKFSELKNTIFLLNSQEKNKELTEKVRRLQNELELCEKMVPNSNTLKSAALALSEACLAEYRHKSSLEKKLEEAEFATVKIILKIIDIMEELREQPTSTGQQDILALLQAYKHQSTTAQTEIKNLQKRLQTCEQCSELQEKYMALQSSLNQMEAQCSENEQQINELQDHLDSKTEELKSKSDTVTSLTLQISTLSVQLEKLNGQLTSSVSKSKVEEFQRIIDEKNIELNNKTTELKQRSTQAQRLLQIIALQVQIEKQVNVATNESDYIKIRALQDHLSHLISGIKDKDNENTKLMFQILAHQDELDRLKTQEKSQLKAQADRIKDLEKELDHIRYQIIEKTTMLNSSNRNTVNLSAQILDLNGKIKPLDDELTDLKETYAENFAEFQERLNITKSQLEDVELQLKDSDEKNYKLMMEIAEIRTQLKKAQRKAAKKNSSDLEQQLTAQEQENRKLERTNENLKQQIDEMKTCCAIKNPCEDVQRQLQQSREDADRFYQLLQEKDAEIRRLQRDFEGQRQEKNQLQQDYNNLLMKLNNTEDQTIHPIKVTMDPETAHPRIHLSAGESEISTTDDVIWVEDNPGRFDVVIAALGKTGFLGGRYYWEVSLAEKNCYLIGMASESAPRKGALTFNPSNGFWTIILNRQGKFQAKEVRPVDIQVQTQPLRLGVLLDYNKGQISFYDAGNKSHVYTFSGQKFTDKIYPFVNYCIEDVGIPRPLVLLPPGSTDWIK